MAKAKAVATPRESRGAYARERANLTQDLVDRRARRLIAGEELQGRGLDLVDTGTQGLVLRITRRSATWLFKHRSGTVRLGDLKGLPVAAARLAADKARVAVAEGTDIREGLRFMAAASALGGSPEDAMDAAFPEYVEDRPDDVRRREGPWEWRDLVDLYLAVKLPTQSPRWAPQYEKHLRATVDSHLQHKLVRDITQADLIALRNRLAKKRAPSAVAESIEAVKAGLDWAKRSEPVISGLAAAAYPWWREGVHVDYQSDVREHTPSIEELARTLVLAEHYRSLGGTAKETDDATVAALWAVVLTGQRVAALVGTKRGTTRDWPDRPGWKLWTWTAQEMKRPGGGAKGSRQRKPKPHGIPVPPAAVAALARFEVDPHSRFLFPGRVPGKSVTASAITGLMDRLKGKAKDARNGGRTVRPEGDLLEAHGIRHWTPHDVRRSLPTHLDFERLGGSGSAILAHSKRKANGDADEERELPAAMTLKHYIHSQRMEAKAPGMEVWTSAVLEAYATERAAFDARLAAGRPGNR